MEILPPDFDLWSQEKRLEWHQKRIKRESLAYDCLETEEILTTKTVERVLDQLAEIRAEQRMVEAMLAVVETPEFIEIRGRLNAAMDKAREIVRLRWGVLQKQFRRVQVCDKGNETAYLEQLAGNLDRAIDAAEEIELEIIVYCEKHGINPLPFFRVDEELGKHRTEQERENEQQPKESYHVSDWIRRKLRPSNNT